MRKSRLPRWARAIGDAGDAPAYCHALSQPFNHPKLGEFRADIAYGGVLYAIVDPAQFSKDIRPENTRKLAEIGASVHQVVDQASDLVHPEHPSIQGLAYVMLATHYADGYRTATMMQKVSTLLRK